MDWPKIIYDAIGPKFPTGSLIVVTLLGALLFGGAWWLLGKQYQKDHPKIAARVAPPLESKASVPLANEQTPSSVAPVHGISTAKKDGPLVPDENPQPTPSIHEQDGKGPSRTGDIRIGANSPITGSTINTGIINLGPPKPYILTTEDQRKAQGKLLTASARLHLVCIGRGCQSADSLCSAFSGTSWIVSRTIIGQFISVGSDVDLSAGIHIMAQDADPSALQSLRSALEVLPIRYELAPWMPIGGPPPDTRLILVFGNPE